MGANSIDFGGLFRGLMKNYLQQAEHWDVWPQCQWWLPCSCIEYFPHIFLYILEPPETLRLCAVRARVHSCWLGGARGCDQKLKWVSGPLPPLLLWGAVNMKDPEALLGKVQNIPMKMTGETAPLLRIYLHSLLPTAQSSILSLTLLFSPFFTSLS